MSLSACSCVTTLRSSPVLFPVSCRVFPWYVFCFFVHCFMFLQSPCDYWFEIYFWFELNPWFVLYVTLLGFLGYFSFSYQCSHFVSSRPNLPSPNKQKTQPNLKNTDTYQHCMTCLMDGYTLTHQNTQLSYSPAGEFNITFSRWIGTFH